MKDVFNKLIKDKRIIIALIALAGMSLVILSHLSTSQSETQADDTVFDSEYIALLENRVKSIVSTIENAGSCEVMINVASTAESVYVKEIKKSSDSNKTESENTVLTMTDGSGNQYAVITKKLMPEITGVIITCDGGNNSTVKSAVTEAVCTVLGIGSNNVCVIAKS